jgi:peptidyl-prolyl cis-trans isomerase D
VETGPSQLVSGRVTQYAPARTLPLAEVRDNRARQAGRKPGRGAGPQGGSGAPGAWKAKPADMTAPNVVVSREQAQTVHPLVLKAALQADPQALPALVGVDLGAQGYAVVKVNRIVSRTAPDAAAAKQAREQYAQVWANAENQAYYEMLKERFKAKITVPQVPGNACNGGLRPANR